MVGGAKGAGCDERGAGAGKAGNAMDAGGLEGVGEGHLWQDGSELMHGHHGEDLMLLGKR
jgi:hypothetical protein